MAQVVKKLCCSIAAVGLLLALLAGVAGCGRKAKPLAPRYVNLPDKQVPAYLKDSIFERTNLTNTEPYPISGYGLVVGLLGTGGTANTPGPVRTYMIEEMVKHKFGQAMGGERYQRMVPEEMLATPYVSIVTVLGFIPPGARAGQRIDVTVQAMEDSNTTSLARGILYRTDLYSGAANPLMPRRVNPGARAQGDVFVNPAHTLSSPKNASPTTRASLRTGAIMDGGVVVQDRALILRLLRPQLSLARAIEARVNLAFPQPKDEPAVAQAQDEGMVHVYVPRRFGGDWQHFAGVVTHLYLNATAEFSAVRARELAEEAVKPDAPLEDISYAWEGMGEPALPFIQPLYVHSSPDVAFAAARAGALIGDSSAMAALLDIARGNEHPFQLNAVRAMAALPPTPRLDQMLDELLDSGRSLVRIEAYRILASRDYRHARIQSEVVVRRHPRQEPFVLDVIASKGEPLIYATRSGIPRIAVFGRETSLRVPVSFAAFDYKLTITSERQNRQAISIYYRGEELPQPVQMRSGTNVPELIWRLGGGTNEGLRLSYAEVIGILQSLSERQDIPASVVLQDVPAAEDLIKDAPPLPQPRGRPVTGRPDDGAALQAGTGTTVAAPGQSPRQR